MKHLKRYLNRKIVVQLDAVVWTGTLVHAGRDEIELANATAGVHSNQVPADGRIVIPELQIQYVQVPD
jgi:hypothetical protein